MSDAQSNSVEIEETPDGALLLHIPPARTIGESLERGVAQMWEFARNKGGPAFGFVVAVTAISAIDSGPGSTDSTFWERLDAAWHLFAYYELPIFAVVFGLLFVSGVLLTLYRDRTLHAGGVLRADEGTIEYREIGPFADDSVFATPVEDVEYIQLSSIQKPSIQERIEPDCDREITLVTSDDMQVVARGLGASTSNRLVEKLEQSIPSLQTDEPRDSP